MKKIFVYLGLYLMTSSVLADGIVINNNTNYPVNGKPGKIALQWVNSAEGTQKANWQMDLSAVTMLSKKGQIKITPPHHAHYFRVLVWSTGKQKADLLTNWVTLVPNKTYTLNQEHLIPAILISGAGC